MAYSGAQVTQLKPSGHPQAKPAGAFAGKTDADAVVTLDDGAWYVVYKNTKGGR